MNHFQDGYILGVDYGEVRIGLAVAHTIAKISRPLMTVPSGADAVSNIVSVVKSESAVGIVVGIPRNMDGTLGAQAQACQSFGEILQAAVADVPVSYIDETLSSVEAEASLQKMPDKTVGIDAVAAAKILERYFEETER